MIALTDLLHSLAVAFCTVSTAMGVSRGHGKTTVAAFEAIDRQPAMRPAIMRSTILALALIETAAILGLLISFFLFFSAPPTLPSALGEIGIAFAIGIPGLVVGWASAGPTSEAIFATARQPFLAQRLSSFMLLVLSLLQTPLIFGFIMAIVIHRMLPTLTTTAQGFTLMGAGVAAGLGAVGPVLGSCLFTKAACKSAGRNKEAFTKIFTFTFISQAIIETPVIFSVIIALMLTSKAATAYENPFIGLAYLAFGATIGLGTFGAGISSGRAAGAAAEQIANNPASYRVISFASLIAQGFIDTIAIFSFLIALLLIFTPLTS